MTNSTATAPALILIVDYFGTLHTRTDCEELHFPVIGALSSTSPTARTGIHCADCD